MYDFLFGDRDPVAEPGTATGTPGDWWTVFALVPDIFPTASAASRVYRSPERRLDPLLRELGQTRAGWLTSASSCTRSIARAAAGSACRRRRSRRSRTGRSPTASTPVERALLAYTDYLVDQRGRVPDAVFDELHRHLSDEEILEFTYITGLYFMHAVMTKALRLEWDDRDDPIDRDAIPDGFDPVAFAHD